MKRTSFFKILLAITALSVLPSCGPDEDPLAHLTDGVHVTTSQPDCITAYTATCGAQVTANDNGLLIELGICWSMYENPTIDNFVSKTYKCSEPFVGFMTNLEPNTEYHVRGYAQYGTEYVYGEDRTFTTREIDPSSSPVTTMAAYDITANSFTCEIQMEPFGAINWLVGICYSQNTDFTMDNCEGYFQGQFLQNDNLYQYACYCHGLKANTTYYYRAFVAYPDSYNSGYNNYFYGEIMSVTTLDIPLSLSLYTYYPYYYNYDNHIEASGRLECNKPEVINEVGFCYSNTNEYPQFESDFHTTAGTPTGEWYDFSSNIYNLSANSKYYIRSYARYLNDSVSYGNIEQVYTY